ncbi:MAG TPA: hypothetical protein VIP28_15410 [Nocardioides sp.]
MNTTLPNEMAPEQGIPPNAKLAAALDKAGAIVEANGLAHETFWDGWQHGDWTPGQPCCTAGAVVIAQYPKASTIEVALMTGQMAYGLTIHPAFQALLDHLGLPDLEALYDWNDDPARTEADVARTLRECAADLRGAA